MMETNVFHNTSQILGAVDSSINLQPHHTVILNASTFHFTYI